MKKNGKKFMPLLLAVTLFMETIPVFALTKNETVYSKLNADGSVKNIIVNDYLKNDGKDVLEDLSNLKNILNINGEEKYELTDNRLIWQAKGNDIYYQGEIDKNLPVQQIITYELDGKEIKINDLLGKKGHVKIHIKYINTDSHLVRVNGVDTSLYTPFVVTMGTIIPMDENHNITVTNGKVISNGQNNIVVSLATPGLYDSLKIDGFDLLDSIIIEYDTNYFKLNSMYSVVSSKLISNDDLKVFDKLDSLYSKVNILNASGKELVSGSNDLFDGAKELRNGVSDLKDGMNIIYEGSKQITNIVNDSILKFENDNSEVLDTTALNMISSQAEAEALKVYQNQETIIASNAIKAIQSSTEYQNLLAQYNVAIQNGNQVQASTYQTMMTLMEETAKKTALETAKTVTTTLASSISTSVAKEVASSAKKMFVNQTLNSLTSLKEGLNELSSGLGTLTEGVSTLYDGTFTLVEGIRTLNEGLIKFDQEGIEEISNFVNGTVKGMENRLKTLVQLGNKYDTFTMKSSEDNGETKFVFVVDSMEKKEKEVEVSKEKSDKSLWDKVKGWFKK